MSGVPMETLLSPEFWSDQITAALKGWAILIAVILFLWAVFKIKLAKANKATRGLRGYAEAVESRLQLARELNAGEAKAIAEIRTEVDGLLELIKAKEGPSAVEPTIDKLNVSVRKLAMTNNTTDHILTAKELAIGDLEEEQKLRLVPRPR